MQYSKPPSQAPAFYRDRTGQPITAQRWAELHGDAKYRIVERTEIDDGQWIVVTIWTGLDTDAAILNREPHVFESFVSRQRTPDGRSDPAVQSYYSENEARAGHLLLVARTRARAEKASKGQGV